MFIFPFIQNAFATLLLFIVFENHRNSHIYFVNSNEKLIFNHCVLPLLKSLLLMLLENLFEIKVETSENQVEFFISQKKENNARG